MRAASVRRLGGHRPVDATGEDRRGPAGQGGGVGGGVDPAGEAGDDRDAGLGERGGEAAGHALAQR